MPVTAFRAGREITDDDELRAHLASLIRLENVGLLLGAGASCSAGGRTMRQLWNDFVGTYPDEASWLRDQGFVQPWHVPASFNAAHENANDAASSDAQPTQTDNVSTEEVQPTNEGQEVSTPEEGDGEHAEGLDVAAQEAGAAPEPAPQDTVPNIERLVDSLEIAIVERARQGNPWTNAVNARAALFRAVVRASLLDEAWWSPPGPDVTQDGLQDHREILQKLTAARQPGQAAPWVFTTNYDLAVEWAAESIDLHVVNGFLGLHTRRFSPQSFDLGYRNVQARGEARFGAYNIYLAKLHGSLTWKEWDHEIVEVPASQAWPELERFLDEESDDLTYRVLPRAAKYLETTGYVLGELLRRFSEFLSRPQTAMVIAGYAFGDEHINRLLRSAMLNPTLHLVVYLPEFTGDPASTELAPTLRRLLALRNPRLTVVGGGEQAFLSALAQHLPEPAVFDEDLHELRKRLRKDEDAGEAE